MSECKTAGRDCAAHDCGLVGCRAPDETFDPVLGPHTVVLNIDETPRAAEAKDTNPKDMIAGDKVPLGLCPDTLIVAVAAAFIEGGAKYGLANYKVSGARASVYHDALKRHIASWHGGEDIDPDSGLPHLWKAAACIAILIDCGEIGNLKDDRPPRTPVSEMLSRLSPSVKAIIEKHKDRRPRHYTIADSPEARP